MREITGWQKTQAVKRALAVVSSEGRFIDYGAELRIVRPDPNGYEPIPGMSKVRTLGTHTFGGMWDMRRRAFVGASRNPVIWYASPEQARLVLHEDLPLKVICLSAEGAGKTRGVLATWLAIQCLKFAGQSVEGGCTAPSGPRLETLKMALTETMPPHWFSYHAHQKLFKLHCGPRLRLLSAIGHSGEAGSPIQGWDWAFAGGDELQDHVSSNADIEARGRRAPGGQYKRMNTVTFKDLSTFRTFLDKWEANPLCAVVRLPGRTNPFVSPQHWENMKLVLSEREYKRRVLAEPTAAENATYYTYDRATNLRRIPRDAVDITATLMRRHFGGDYHLLCGHDPGTLRDVTIMMRAYLVPGSQLPHWWVVGELVTKATTTDEHIFKLRRRLAEMGVHGNQFPPKTPIIFADPSSGNESADRPHVSVYRQFKAAGFEIRSAAPTSPKFVPQEARIEMIASLLRNAAGKSRLFIDIDERGNPVAPNLVRALEHSERDDQGRAEQERKSKRYKDTDYSDCPAALGYGLWRIERAKSAGRMEVAA